VYCTQCTDLNPVLHGIKFFLTIAQRQIIFQIVFQDNVVIMILRLFWEQQVFECFSRPQQISSGNTYKQITLEKESCLYHKLHGFIWTCRSGAFGHEMLRACLTYSLT